MKRTIIVVQTPSHWPLQIPGVEVVGARTYLTDPSFSLSSQIRVFNVCRSYRYQSLGYYVSLLAQARGHKTIPSVTTIQDLKTPTLFRTISDDLDDLIQHSLAPLKSDRFTLSIYFGRNLAKRYERLSWSFFRLFEAPLLRVSFRHADEGWEVRDISLLGTSDLPQEHRSFVVEAAQEYLARPAVRAPRKKNLPYELAILWDSGEASPRASDEKAVRRFCSAAESLGMDTEIIGRGDYGRLAEFDALFIRDTTNVDHYTYRFSRRASAEGLIVIDDPDSILRCTNKVYLAELLDRHRIPIPRTLVLGRESRDDVVDQLGLPCILKEPDSSFSQGVKKVETREDLELQLSRLLEGSELVIAQEFLPTAFDWRVGIINRRPLYVCRYHMARRHWQIVKRDGDGRRLYGRVEAVPLDEAPEEVVSLALKAANLIGDGFYGVDLKQSGDRSVIIEINDNPSVDAGYEDALLKDQLYLEIMKVFRERLDRLKGNSR